MKQNRSKSINKSKRSFPVFGIILLLVVALIGFGFYYYDNNEIPLKGLLNEEAQNVQRLAGDSLKSLAAKVQEKTSGNEEELEIQPEAILRVGLISDSHGNGASLRLAIEMMQMREVDHIIHLGDISESGELDSFLQARVILENSGTPYTVLPGDHDFNWYPNYSKENFYDVFGYSSDLTYQVLKDHIGFVFLDNSGKGESKAQELKEVISELNTNSSNELNLLVIFSSSPLYSPYFGEKEDIYGDEYIEMLTGENVDLLAAGDTHVYARYMDLSNSIDLLTVGASGEYKSPFPQWVLLEVYSDHSFVTKPIPLVEF